MLIRASARSSMSAHPSVPFPTERSSRCRVVPFPHHPSRRAPSLPAPLTCAARSLAIRLSPNAIGRIADPAIAARTHVPWRLRSFSLSQGHPRAWPVLVVLARRCLPLGPTPTTGINWPRPSPVMCCKCMFQVFQRYVAIVTYGCWKSRSECFTCCIFL
jgi:hypothetical protein